MGLEVPEGFFLLGAVGGVAGAEPGVVVRSVATARPLAATAGVHAGELDAELPERHFVFEASGLFAKSAHPRGHLGGRGGGLAAGGARRLGGRLVALAAVRTLKHPRAPLDREQHEGLHHHPDISPLRRPAASVYAEEKSYRRIEEPEVFALHFNGTGVVFHD